MHTATILRPLPLTSRCIAQQSSRTPVLSFIRSKSTATATKEAETAAETSTRINWPQYLAIRKSRRRWQTAATVPSSFLGFGTGAAYFANLDTDPMKPIMGIDPFFFYGICTLGCLGLGYLVGPSIGTGIWRFTHRRVLSQIDARDREFYQRVAKNRVDADLQIATQPVPDYYGERIGSLHEYRQWLRDQGKYRRKVLLPEEIN